MTKPRADRIAFVGFTLMLIAIALPAVPALLLPVSISAVVLSVWGVTELLVEFHQAWKEPK